MASVHWFQWEVAGFNRDGYLGMLIESQTYADAVWIARRFLRHRRIAGASGPYSPQVKLTYMPTRQYSGKRYLPDEGRAVPKDRCSVLSAYSNGEAVAEVVLQDVTTAICLGRAWTSEQLGNTYRISPTYRIHKCANGMPMYFRYPASSSVQENTFAQVGFGL